MSMLRPRDPRWLGALGAGLTLVLLPSCSDNDEGRSVRFEDALNFHIEYLISSEPPDGWTLAWAVERTGIDQGVPPDYTVVYAPAELVGETRSEGTELPEEAPSLALNVGARGWLVGVEEEFAPDLDSAEMEVVCRWGAAVPAWFVTCSFVPPRPASTPRFAE